MYNRIKRPMPSDTLHDITIRGFKSISSMRVMLQPINIVIGANGSGKSNFIGAFAFLREIGAGRLKAYVGNAGGAEKILHFGSKTTDRISLRVSFNQRNNPMAPSVYGLTLAPTSDDGLFPAAEELSLGPYPRPLTRWHLPLEAAITNPASEVETEGLRQDLDQWQPCHLHDTSYMRKTARLDDNRFLDGNGANLPAILFYLKEKWADSYRMIVDTVRQVAPFFGDFDLIPRNLDAREIILEWRHLGSEQRFAASSLSDGTLRFIALATLLLDPRRNRRSLILIDEPELGLHPLRDRVTRFAGSASSY